VYSANQIIAYAAHDDHGRNGPQQHYRHFDSSSFAHD
jgi:hypothetical protein